MTVQTYCVRVVNPTFVFRVGYPRHVGDYLNTLRAAGGDKEIADAVRKVTGDARLDADNTVLKRILRDTAYLMAKRDGFGGKQRTLHTVELPDLVGRDFLVDAPPRRAVTGVYRAGHTFYHHDYSPDYEPPCLTAQVRHTLLGTPFSVYRDTLRLVERGTYATESDVWNLWIERGNTEVVIDDPAR